MCTTFNNNPTDKTQHLLAEVAHFTAHAFSTVSVEHISLPTALENSLKPLKPKTAS